MNFRARSLVGLVVMLSAVGCQCGDMVPAVDPMSIIVEPATVTVEVGSSAPLRARRVNGEDVTDRVTWASADGALARVEGGLVTGLAAGRVTVQASLDTYAAAAEVDVSRAPPPASCSDGLKNGRETGPDCGGPNCARCLAGEPCSGPQDCDASVCSGGVCQASTCFDGVKNGGETGLDCGGPSCGGCAAGGACAVGTDCHSGVCADGVCQADSCQDGIANGNETGVDCGGGGCPGCATGGNCRSDADCDSKVCVGGVCEAATCSDQRQNGDETAPDCGGATCPRCTPGLPCAGDTDCHSGVCRDELCQAPLCTDGVSNGVETGVDCGGPTCAACDAGGLCAQGSDCLSRVCTGGVCRGATCTDGVSNDGETGVDCGGSLCPRCGDGEGCASDADCQSGACHERQCVPPTCADGARNGAETALDCGGPDCAPCGTAMACAVNGDCASGVCAGGFCQAATCTDGVRNGAETATDCGGGACPGCSLGLTCTVNGDCATGHCEVGSCAPPFVLSVVVNPGSVTLPLGGTQALVAHELMSDGTVRDVTTSARWSIDDPTIATVSASGLVTAVRRGTAVARAVAATLTSNAVTVLVGEPRLETIEVAPVGVQLPQGLVQAFQATGTYSDGSLADLTGAVTWASADPSVATIASTGRATALSTGASLITAAQGGVTGATLLQVTSVFVTGLSVGPDALTLPVGVRARLSATAMLSDGSARDVTDQAQWSSGTPGVATVTDGLVTALTPGSATLTASLGGLSASSTLTVNDATLQAMEVFPADETLPRGFELQYAAVGHYSDGRAYDLTLTARWTSSEPTVATISSALPTPGLARTLAVGATQLEAAVGAIHGATSLTVNTSILTALSVTPAQVVLPIGAPRQYQATGVFSDGTARDVTRLVRWSTGNLGVASISNALGSHGLLTALGAGNTPVTAALGGLQAVGQLRVTSATLEQLTVSPATARLGLQGVVLLSATAIYTDGTSLDVTEFAGWSSAQPAVASVRNDTGFRGVTVGVGQGLTSVTARFGNAAASAAITVTNAVLQDLYISPAVVRTGLGIDVQFSVSGVWNDGTTADLSRVATWSSSLDSVAVISNAIGSRGLASTRGVGVTTIRATWAGQEDTTTLTVTNARLTSLTLTPATHLTGIGVEVDYRAVAAFDDGTTFDVTTVAAWTSSEPAVASISGARGSVGVATALAGGTTTIRAQLGAVFGTASLTVSSAALAGLAVTPATGIIPLGYWRPYTAIARYADGLEIDVTRQVTWSTGTPTVAVAGNGRLYGGRVTGLGVGTSTVVARFGAATGTALADVRAMRLTDIEVTPEDQSTPMGTPIQLTAMGSFTDGAGTVIELDVTLQVGWKVAPKKNGTVSNTDGSRGAVTMYNADSAANILAQAWEPGHGGTLTGNTKVYAP